MQRSDHANSLLRIDTDLGYLVVCVALAVFLAAIMYSHGFWAMAIMASLAILIWLARIAPGVLFRSFCLPRSPLPRGARALTVAAVLQEFPPKPARPRLTVGRLYLTDEMMLFHSRTRSITVPLTTIKSVESELLPSTWGIFARVRRLHLQTNEARVVLAVNHPCALRAELEKRRSLLGGSKAAMWE